MRQLVLKQVSISLRAQSGRQDRVELQEYRRVTSDALGLVGPTPAILEEALKWRGGILDVVSDVLILERKNKKYWFQRLRDAVNSST